MTAETSRSDEKETASGIFESVTNAIDGVSDSADVHRVYGDPITVADKTLIPVARLAYGIGGGFGSSSGEDTEDSEGGGGGCGMMAHPVGVLEVTEEETRFIRFSSTKRTVIALGLGVLLGLLVGRRRDRSA